MATILVVEDKLSSREYLAMLLGYQGHRVLEAADGTEGLEIARRERPDLIITDIVMPTMNGFEFVTRLRASPAFANTKVIFYSATFLERETRALAQASGASFWLPKPAEPESVLSLVNRVLDSAAPVPAGVSADSTSVAAAPEPNAIALLVDAFREKGQEAEAISLRLNALVEAGVELASELDPDELLRRSCHAVRKLIGASYATLGLLNPQHNALCQLFTSGLPPQTALNGEIPLPLQDAMQNAVALDRPHRRRGTPIDASLIGLPPTLGPLRTLLTVPVRSPNLLYGWICLAEKIGLAEFSDEDERIGVALAAQLGVAYENALRYRQSENQCLALEAEILQRRETEDALRASESRHRELVENALHAIYVATLNGRFLEANPALLKMLGCDSKEELLRLNLMTDVYRYPQQRLQLLEQIRQTGHFEGEEIEWKRKDGQMVVVRLSGRLVRDAKGELNHVEAIAEDITEHRKLEEQLRQAQKMEAIGNLAGGIAHDFNNFLGIIIGYAETILDDTTLSHSLRRKIEQMKNAGQSAALLIRQLLAFSRRQVLAPQLLDLNAVISEMEKMLCRVVSENIEIGLRLDPNLETLKADRSQIEQVILNLVVNAADAMPEGGKLTFETANVELDESYASQHVNLRHGPYVMLAVSDTGVGMDAYTQTRIFEPFFTTKEKGKGTGLGLATVYGIIKQSGGHIWVYSELGRGTTFKVYFPRLKQRAEKAPSAAATAQPPRGSETILLVEDAAALRELTRESLEALGYTVLEAEHGNAALPLAQQTKDTIHLLLTDVVLPGMSGREVAERLRQLHPETRVLYMSGYTDNAIVHHGVLQPGLHFIQKPFRPGDLARKIRETLDSQ